jgi:hypothetical protein
MLDGTSLVAKIQNFGHVLRIHDFDDKFTEQFRQRFAPCRFDLPNSLACHSRPIAIWRQRNIPDWESASDQDLV